MNGDHDGLRGRVTKQGEEALGKLAQDLLKSPLVSGTVTVAFDARERASRAQELAMSALNLPSAADVDRLTRRLRSVSQRIEGLEEGLDRISDRLDNPRQTAGLEQRMEKLEKRLTSIDRTLTRLDKKVSEPS
jgi:predicted  nucleic acid-binding Zn-ribbon protein